LKQLGFCLSVFFCFLLRAETPPKETVGKFNTMMRLTRAALSKETVSLTNAERVQLQRAVQNLAAAIDEADESTALSNYLTKERLTENNDWIKDLLDIAARVSKDPEAAELIMKEGIHTLLIRLGLPQITDDAETRAKLVFVTGLEAQDKRFIELDQAADKAMESFASITKTLGRLKRNLLMLDMGLTSALLCLLYNTVGDSVPAWLMTPRWLATYASVAFLQNYGIFEVSWLYGHSYLASKTNYDAVVIDIKDLLKVDLPKVLPLIENLALYKDLKMRVLENAALDALSLLQNEPIVAQALMRVAITSIEEGYISRGETILKKLIDNQFIPEHKLAESIQKVFDTKKALEAKITRERFGYLLKWVGGGLAVIGAATMGINALSPDNIGPFGVIISQILGFIGIKRMVLKPWLASPTDKLRKKLKKEYDDFVDSLSEVLTLAPDQTLDVVESLATDDGYTHSFIREAAREALMKCDDPRVGQILLKLGGKNLRRRGPMEITGYNIKASFKSYRGCIARLLNIRLPSPSK